MRRQVWRSGEAGEQTASMLMGVICGILDWVIWEDLRRLGLCYS